MLKWSDLSTARYMNAGDVAGKSKTVTVKNIRMEKMPDNSSKAVCYFEEEQKGVVLNATRKNFLRELSKSPNVDDAIGIKLQLCGGTTSFQGQDRACIKFAMTSAAASKQVADELDDEIKF